MKTWFRGVRANWIYLRRPFLEFLPSLMLLFALTVIGGWAFQLLYVPGPDEAPLSYVRALHAAYGLIFMQQALPFPEHWLLQGFYFLLPPLGLVVILDGMARFGYHVLRRDAKGEEWMRALAKTYSNHVILCGLGKVGVRVLEQLLRLGEEVVAVEKEAQNENIAYAQQHGVPVIIGHTREAGLLADLNVSQAKSIIAATNDDLANLEIALDARKANPQIRVVMRMFDQELAGKVRNAFDVHLVFSTSTLAAPLFATAASDRSIVNSFYVGEQLLVVARFTINGGSKLIGTKIGDIGLEHKAFFLAHQRALRETPFPGADLDFQPGDELVVQTEPETLKMLHVWNKDKLPY